MSRPMARSFRLEFPEPRHARHQIDPRRPRAFRADLLRRKPDRGSPPTRCWHRCSRSTTRAARRSPSCRRAQERRNAASKEIGAAMKAKDMPLGRGAEGRSRRAEGSMGAASRPRSSDAIAALEKALAAIPNRPLAERAGRQGRARQCRGAALVGEPSRLSGASRRRSISRSARRLALMDFEAAAQAVRRALRRAQGQAGAAGARARAVHARPAHGRARLSRKSRRRCWCATTPCSARRNCRNSRTTSSPRYGPSRRRGAE